MATIAVLAGCGGNADGGAASPAGGSGGAGATGGSSAGGSGASGGVAGGSSAGGSSAVGGNNDGGSAGFGGFGGSAGYGGTGQGGGTGECPTEPPLGADCTGVGAGTLCDYAVDCESGSQRLTYACGANGSWGLVPSACSNAWDSCLSVYVQCRGGTWIAWDEWGGSNPPPPCPTERPEVGSSCAEIQTIGGVPTCGYYCDDGQTWTVAGCTLDELKWELDGSCTSQ
ncbi:MAG: hypothetical protein R3B07_37870 [Polyangiaceae bacterium]